MEVLDKHKSQTAILFLYLYLIVFLILRKYLIKK